MDSITLLECFLTATVVVTQVRCFLTTKNHCSTLAAVFPDYEPVAEIKESYAPEATEHSIEVRRRVEPSGPVSQSFTKILAATNSYLDKNFGAPADFRILDGIAERVSAAVEQEASANATLPLYIGLMGTFMGVIVGLLTVAFETSASISDSDLKRFLGGVLVAMSGSLCGLILTVVGRGYFLHRARLKNDACKNQYFTFLQAELLPVVGYDVTVTLQTLQGNLHKFNQDFASSLSNFSQALGAVTETVREQRELLDTIKSANLLKVYID